MPDDNTTDTRTPSEIAHLRLLQAVLAIEIALQDGVDDVRAAFLLRDIQRRTSTLSGELGELVDAGRLP